MQTSPDIKAWLEDLLTLMQSEFAEFISHIPQNQKDVATHLKDWSPKDEMNHLVFWNSIFIFNVKARQNNQPILDPRNYLVMNDVGWFENKNKTWEETQQSITKVFDDISKLIASMSEDDLVDAEKFSLKYSAKPKPFIADMLYEVVDHPLHHILGMYEKFGNAKDAKAMLLRINDLLQRSEVAAFTSKSKTKVEKYLKTV